MCTDEPATVRERLDSTNQRSIANAVVPPWSGHESRAITTARRSEAFEIAAVNSPTGAFASFQFGLAWCFDVYGRFDPMCDVLRDVREVEEVERQEMNEYLEAVRTRPTPTVASTTATYRLGEAGPSNHQQAGPSGMGRRGFLPVPEAHW